MMKNFMDPLKSEHERQERKKIAPARRPVTTSTPLRATPTQPFRPAPARYNNSSTCAFNEWLGDHGMTWISIAVFLVGAYFLQPLFGQTFVGNSKTALVFSIVLCCIAVIQCWRLYMYSESGDSCTRRLMLLIFFFPSIGMIISGSILMHAGGTLDDGQT